jgi:tetratricopeptide (TPR) repeat protein
VESSYIVVVRLVTADSARELMSFRGTARNADAIIEVADDLSRKLRAKAGESLRQVQATPRLAYASTSSLDALRKYSEAARANDIERDYPRSITLLREAVALDSNFAEGWRKLAVAIRNAGRYAPAVSDSAIMRAFALSDRMTERERDAVIGYYYSGSPGFDREKAVAAYRRMLARGDSIVALQNLGVIYTQRREYAKAESLYAAGARLQPGNLSAYSNLVAALARAGKMRERDSVIAVIAQRFPGQATIGERRIEALGDDGRFDEAVAAADSSRKAGNRRDPALPQYTVSYLATVRGRFRAGAASRWQARAIDSASGRPYPRLFTSGPELDDKVAAGLPFEAELKAFERDVDAGMLAAAVLRNRPDPQIAQWLARAGQVDRARQTLAQYESVLASDTAFRRWQTPYVQRAQAEIALAERKWSEAAALFRRSDRREDGPVANCPECLPRDIMRTFALAGMADSAVVVYEAYRATSWGRRARQGPDRSLDGGLTEAMAKIYDAKGNRARAAELYRDFIEMWKDADPEVQPRVQAARVRLRELEPVEGRRP